MDARRSLRTVVALAGVAFLLQARSAGAITLPDTGQCTSNNNTVPCLIITNNGTTEDAYAIAGWVNLNSNGSAVDGHADGPGRGVVGYSLSYRGVEGTSQSGDGVVGIAHAQGHGVFGYADDVGTGIGVMGQGVSNAGVYGTSSSGNGATGTSTSGFGVWGGSSAYGSSTSNVGGVRHLLLKHRALRDVECLSRSLCHDL